jgi:hypothetical protein
MERTTATEIEIAPADMLALAGARSDIESESLATRLTAVVGTPLEAAMKRLPATVQQTAMSVAETCIHRLLDTAVTTLPTGQRGKPENQRNKYLGMGAGAVGGFFGLPGLLVELPVTTGIMLRSIADIAAAEGEDLSAPDSRLACVEVFALGGPRIADDAAETGYYGLRLALSLQLSAVSRQVLERGVLDRAVPVVADLVRVLATRFGVAVTDKLAFQMVPVVGAAGGAALNAIFIQHFQDTARGHFTVRRLERRYGVDAVRRAYRELGDDATSTPAPRDRH